MVLCDGHSEVGLCVKYWLLALVLMCLSKGLSARAAQGGYLRLKTKVPALAGLCPADGFLPEPNSRSTQLRSRSSYGTIQRISQDPLSSIGGPPTFFVKYGGILVVTSNMMRLAR